MKVRLFELIQKAYKHPEKIITNLGRRGFLNWMSDEVYIKLLFYSVFRYLPDLNNPKTFNEKIQWLKLYDHNAQYTKMVDKYEAKKYVAEKIGEEYIIPTLGIWDRFDEINFDQLPNQFVLKCTHDSGGIVICKNKAELDINTVKKRINRALKQNFFYYGREYPYKNVKPRIIVEKYMEDFKDCGLRDYKFYTFNGVPRVLLIVSERENKNKETSFDFFDMNFKYLDLKRGHCNSTCKPHKPEMFDMMRKFAGILGQGFSFLRVDFYEVNGKIYFGELTFSPASGIQPFEPEKWDEKFGSWLKLPEKCGEI